MPGSKLPSKIFTMFRGGYFTTSLNSLFQCLTILLLKKISLIPNKNFPCSLCLFSLTQTPCTFKKKKSPAAYFLIASHQVVEDNRCLLRLLQMKIHNSLSPQYIMYSRHIHLWRYFTELFPACQCWNDLVLRSFELECTIRQN